MCGIAGVYLFEGCGIGQASRDVKRMLDIMRHRGPDAVEQAVCGDRLVLGAVRLSMEGRLSRRALTEGPGGRVVLAYNGESYSDTAPAAGPQFRTPPTGSSDGERLADALTAMGAAALDTVDGMYAVAFWDADAQTVSLARDPQGIKPLYYHVGAQRLVFASELKAIRAVVDGLSIDPKGLAYYSALRFIPAPYTPMDRVRKLVPGEVRIYDGKHARVLSLANASPGPTARSFGKALEEAVVTTATSESSLGVFLSGGMDSLAILLSLGKKQHRLPAFSADYEPSDDDEIENARRAADFVGTQHFTALVSDTFVEDWLSRIAYSLDEPIFSSVSLSTFALARLASLRVKGVLSGDGSDELLMGYAYMRRAIASGADEDWHVGYRRELGWIDDATRRQLFPDHKTVGLHEWCEGKPAEEGMRHFECRVRLPDYHLHRLDRLTMANSIEARLPYLRRNVVSAALGYPAPVLLDSADEKLPLRSALKDQLGWTTPIRGKRPFYAPVERWLKGPLARRVEALRDQGSFLESCGVDGRHVGALIDRFRSDDCATDQLWGLLALESWYSG
jgi:asparagine synthase (glutamine-hydrolysing)